MSYRTNTIGFGVVTSLLLSSCGGGSGGTPAPVAGPNPGATPIAGPMTVPGSVDQNTNTETLQQRMTTGADSSDTDKRWACTYPGDNNDQTTFFFWEDGAGRNVFDAQSVNFTWTADEANQAVNAIIQDLGIQGGLNSIEFDSDSSFTAVDTLADRAISCNLQTESASEPAPVSLAIVLSNGRDASNRASFWDCGTTSYSFLDDGAALYTNGTSESFLTWEISSANSVLGLGADGFVLQNIEFGNNESFTATEFVSGKNEVCVLTDINVTTEKLITGNSVNDIGNASWSCGLTSNPDLDIFLLLYRDGNGQSLSFERDRQDIDGFALVWDVDPDSGVVAFNGDELANFTFDSTTRFSANFDGGTLSCDRVARLPLTLLLPTGATAEDTFQSWTCEDEIALRFGVDGSFASIERNQTDLGTWALVQSDNANDVLLTNALSANQLLLTDIEFADISTFSTTISEQTLSCERS